MKPQTGKRKLKPSGIDWIGDVPEGWSVRRIKYLVGGEGTVFMDGDWINSDIIVDNGVRYLTSGNVGVGVFKRQGNGHITDETFKELNCLKALPGDLMLCRLNEPLGRGCIIPDDEAYYVIAVDNVIFRPEKDYDKRYIMHCVSCDRFSTAALIAASGATMQRISRNDLGRLSIPIPPLDEQKRIAAKLDRLCGRIDELSANLTKEIAALQDYRKSLITECVTKGLNPKAKMKPSGVDWIGDVPDGWGILRVGLCFRRHGSGTTPSSDNLMYYEGENNWVQSGDLHGDAVYKTEKHLSDAALQECALTVYKAPFIAVAMYGASIANTSKVMIDACTNQACCVLCEPEDDIELEYCFYAIKAARKVLIEAGRGGGQPNINRDIVRRLKIPVPTAIEQCQIVAFLNKHCAAIDAKIAERQRQLEKLAEYRASAIYEYVTGKKEVAG